VQCNVYEFLMI